MVEDVLTTALASGPHVLAVDGVVESPEKAADMLEVALLLGVFFVRTPFRVHSG